MKQEHITRRNFLKKTSVLAAGAIGFPYLVQSSALGNAGTVAAADA